MPERPADDDFEMTVDSEAVLNRPDLKRTSDVPVERLEEEMKETADPVGDSSGVDSVGNDGIGATLSKLAVQIELMEHDETLFTRNH